MYIADVADKLEVDPLLVFKALKKTCSLGEEGFISNAEEILEKFFHYSNEVTKNPFEFKSELIPFDKGCRVYFLLQDDYVAYVGQTTHLVARIAQHVKDGKSFNYVSFIDVDKWDIDAIEAFNISYHNPSLNINKFTKTELLNIAAKTVSRS